MPTKYAAALSGHPLDTDALRRWFTSDPQVVEIQVPKGRTTALLATEFESLASGEQVQADARRLVGLMNGALFASDVDRAPVQVAGVYERTGNGEWGRGAAYAPFHGGGTSRGRFQSTQIGPGGAPVPEGPSREVAWFALANGPADPNPAADVLRALSREPDWFDLWKAHEIIEGDQHVLPSWPKDEAEWLGATAARYRHSPNHQQGRKAKKWLLDNGKLEMELVDARRLVARLGAEWLDWKVPRRG